MNKNLLKELYLITTALGDKELYFELIDINKDNFQTVFKEILPIFKNYFFENSYTVELTDLAFCLKKEEKYNVIKKIINITNQKINKESVEMLDAVDIKQIIKYFIDNKPETDEDPVDMLKSYLVNNILEKRVGVIEKNIEENYDSDIEDYISFILEISEKEKTMSQETKEVLAQIKNGKLPTKKIS